MTELIDVFRKYVTDKKSSLAASDKQIIEAVNGFVGYLNEQKGMSAQIKGRKVSLSDIKLSIGIEEIAEHFEYSLYIPSMTTVEDMIRKQVICGDDLSQLVDQVTKAVSKVKQGPVWPVFVFDNLEDFIKNAGKSKRKYRGFNICDDRDRRLLAEKIIYNVAEQYIQMEQYKGIADLFHKEDVNKRVGYNPL